MRAVYPLDGVRSANVWMLGSVTVSAKPFSKMRLGVVRVMRFGVWITASTKLRFVLELLGLDAGDLLLAMYWIGLVPLPHVLAVISPSSFGIFKWHPR